MEIESVIEHLAQSLRESGAKTIQKKSKTFWSDLGVKRRSKDIIMRVQVAVLNNDLIIDLKDGELGTEDDDTWLSIQYQGIPIPDDGWFEKMSQKVFDSEAEVNVFFLYPLFEKLGYQETDFYFEYPVVIPKKFIHSDEDEKKRKVSPCQCSRVAVLAP